LRIKVCGIWTVLMIATAAVAQEDTESANFMLPYCKLTPAQTASNQAGGNKAGSPAFLAGRCAGLVQGIADTLALVKEANSDKLTPLCVDRPKGANTDQAVKVVVKYGDTHPDQVHAPFTVVAALALTEAWPCRK
jgi:Rap1a immunity proteins